MPRPKNARRKQQCSVAASTKKTTIDLRPHDLDLSITSTTSSISASRKKIDLMNLSANNCDINTSNQTWILLHLIQLEKLICDLLCPLCMQPGFTVQFAEGAGFCSIMSLHCKLCTYNNSAHSSPKVNTSKSVYEVNRRMTLFSHECGGGQATLQTLCMVMGIPGMSLATYQKHDKTVADAEIVCGDEALKQAATVVRQAYAERDEVLKAAIDAGEEPMINISVSYDGTWHKRGFTSLYGIGTVIDILTGLVLDSYVLSKYCHACKHAEKRTMPDDEREAWEESHNTDCCKNHNGSSKSMEAAAAVKMWGRSEERFGLRYLEMLCDGDSSAFKAICELDPYPGYVVKKLDCVNHAHKRMGTALRKLTKSERLGGKGVGRLTEAKCDNLQNFYRGAILSNLPDIEMMKNGVWSALYHSMSTDKEPRHHQCPTGVDSWCFFQKALAKGESPPSHSEHRQSTYLSLPVAHKMFPIYRRMTEDSLLKRLIHGGTQNTNESLNHLIWIRCPKTIFMGKRRVQAALARAFSTFNEGPLCFVSVLKKLDLSVPKLTVKMLEDKNDLRIKAADAAADSNKKVKRKEYASLRRNNVRREEANDGPCYQAGGF